LEFYKFDNGQRRACRSILANAAASKSSAPVT
jgi:hypothetical protein